jgi:acetyl esterase/lipase
MERAASRRQVPRAWGLTTQSYETANCIAGFTVETASIKMSDGVEISALVYVPKGPPLAIAVFAHGGCFGMGDCTSHVGMSSAMAKVGLLVIDTSYRQGADHPHPAAINDLSDVTRWARARWSQFPLGIAGSSSGGWYAMAMAASPPDEIPFSFAIALCPVADPGLRASYLKSCINKTAEADGYAVFHTGETAAGMLKTQQGYFGSDSAMVEAGVLLKTPGRFHNSPTRSLVILGAMDINVPAAVTAGLQSWATETITLGTLDALARAPGGAFGALGGGDACCSKLLAHTVAVGGPLL